MRIDLWTLALQTINVLVLVWLLARFLFHPVANIIAARRAAADTLLADAEAARAKVADAAAALARRQQNLTNDAQRIIAEARAEAEAERATLLHQATEAASKLQADAQQANERDQRLMREQLAQEARLLAVDIAQRLLQRLPTHVLTQAFMETLVATLATHPARASLAAQPIELHSATPLDATAQADCRAMLARVLQPPPQIEFRTDPNLIAGLELNGPHLLIRNSWRADLQRITKALDEDSTHDLATQHLA